MLVRDIMTWNVITAPSTIPILEAERLLEIRGFHRLPIVDKGQLVGIVTMDDLLNATPHPDTPMARRQVDYLLSKMTVRDVMKTEVVTVHPDIPVEQAVAIGQSKGVGSALVVEDNKVVGILTTNDIFYKIVNPLLGVNESGTRIIVYGGGEAEAMQKAIGIVSKFKVRIKAALTVASREGEKNDLILHLDTDDSASLINNLQESGFSVSTRDFKP